MSGNAEPADKPPASYALGEVQAWFAAIGARPNVSRMDAFRNAQGRLENLELHLEIPRDGRRVVASERFRKQMQGLTGSDRLEGHFELPALTDRVASSLAKGGFRGIRRIQVDAETLWDHEERTKDLRTSMQMVAEAGHRATRCESVVLTAVDDDFGDTALTIELRNVAKKSEHQIQLRFEGAVAEQAFQGLLVELRQDLSQAYNGAA